MHMNIYIKTATGRKMAESRHEVMLQFLAQFQLEVDVWATHTQTHAFLMF